VRVSEEVSWLGLVDRGAFPIPEGISGVSRDLAPYSCGGSAGIAPASLSRRARPTLARRVGG